ncbi:uncharacterized protein [Rutidosis leptorrhynchoides]|uniref:uncharacterized protein isoform X2 n=1 Tax=Rutidosis leptorrhynchoides TaxID=125765 RepID=UPI003A99D27D
MESNKQTFVEQYSEMNQNLTSDKKKKRKKKSSKEPEDSKSKDKQIMSDKPKKASGKGKRTRLCDIYNDAEDLYVCLERAWFFLQRLDKELPKFGKCMLPSNVMYSFWLILPNKFCVTHLPDHDTTITLVDELGKEFKTNFLKARHGLSAGWRGFTTAQRLLQGDILFFCLVEPCKLQVSIVRRYGIEAIEAAVCLMQMRPRSEKKRSSKNLEKAEEVTKEKIKQKAVKLENCELKNQILVPAQTKKGKRTQRIPKRFIPKLSQDTAINVEEEEDRASCVDQCDNGSDGLSSEVQGSTSGITNQSQPDEVGCYKLNPGYQEANISCHSTTERIFHSSTVAT